MKRLALTLSLLAGCAPPPPATPPANVPSPPPPERRIAEAPKAPAEVEPDDAKSDKTPPAEVPSPPPPRRRTAEEPKAPVDFKLEDVKGDKLTFVEAPRADHFRLEHPLVVFACPAGQYEQVRRRHLTDEGPGKPAPFKASEEVLLYVLWGDRLGDPMPEAIVDRKSKRIVVTATWSGRPYMDTGTLYRGYGFKLGPLEAGEYGVWVREASPVDKQGPKLTKSYTFRVEPREDK